MPYKKRIITQEQHDLIIKTLNENNSKIITQEIWEILSKTFKFSKISLIKRSKNKYKIGYSWEEYDQTKHSTKAILQIKCENCSELYVCCFNKIKNRKYKNPVCPSCYRKLYLYDEQWRAKNSKAQLIAQNRTDVLEKHRINSTKMWIENGDKMRAAQLKMVTSDDYRKKMSIVMKNKWREDSSYRDRVNGKGVYKHHGLHKDIVYDSKLELCFLIKMSNECKNVDRCDIIIPYFDPTENKQRDYYPDFIISESGVKTIVEIKGQRWIDKAPKTYYAKIEALKEYCNKNDYKFVVYLDDDLKQYRKEANNYHETQKSNTD